MDKRDIFICHASEDKEEIVKPMVESFNQAGITYWYDEAEIKWGDSITQKVNEGLNISNYVVVVISNVFVSKPWPQKELNSALSIEISSGEVKVLPLLVGSEAEKKQILQKYPLLNDKRYLPWDGNLRKIVKALLSRIKKEDADSSTSYETSGTNINLKIPLPKIKKKFTQRDKDLFLRKTFDIVKRYFKEALNKLDKSYKEVETDYTEVHNFKFVCTIYVRGEVSSRCKIWLGGFLSSDSIAYQSGQFTIDSDNSFSDILSISDNEESLVFSPSNMWFGTSKFSGEKSLEPEQAAEYLWCRFTDNLD